MTNKKLKVAAMSVALTACVAAQPLAVHAASEPRPVDDSAPEPESAAELPSAADEAQEEAKNENINQDPVPSEDQEVKEVFGDDVDVKYDPDKSETNEETGAVTTPGEVIRSDGETTPEEGGTSETDPAESGEVIGSAEHRDRRKH